MKKRFWLITVLLVTIIAFSTTGTVMGMEKGKVKVDEKYYRQIEKEYVKQVRVFLKDAGYDNCGVALTKVFYEDGTREYTLNIHHKRIGKLTVAEKEQLKEELAAVAGVTEQNDIGIESLLVVFS